MGRLTGVARLALVACLLPSGAFAEPVDVREGVDAARSPHAQVDWIREPGGDNPALNSGEKAHLDLQRQFVATLARRHFGGPTTRSKQDLLTLQRIVDEGLVSKDQTYELQALGVALGDVMVAELGYQWVAHVDDTARTRALRYPGSSDVVFPVTMISRRVAAGEPVDVRALFAKSESIARSTE